MKIYLDTANLKEIEEALRLGIVRGVTTNPTLVSKEEGDFFELVKKIAKMVDGPVSAEVIGLQFSEMIKEAEKLAALADNVVIKIPMTSEGLKAVSELSKKGIRTNVTLIFSVNQALLAASAGASYVSPFVGRLDDIGHDGIELVAEITKVLRSYNYPTEVIAASIRHPLHVVQAAKAGADIATVPFKIVMQMTKHPLTDLGIERFLADWSRVKSN